MCLIFESRWKACGLAMLLWAAPLSATQTSRSTLWLQVEAGEDQAAVVEAVRAVVAKSGRYQLLDRTAGLDKCCTETACLIDDMMKRGAAGALVVRVARHPSSTLATAKIVFPSLTGTPRRYALAPREPAKMAAIVVEDLLLASPPAPGGSRVAMMPVRTDERSPWPKAIFDDLLLSILATAGKVDSVSQEDVDDLLGTRLSPAPANAARAREPCAGISAGALAVEFLITSNLGSVGRDHVLSVKLIDVAKAKVKARASRVAPGGPTELPKVFAGAFREILGFAGLR